jgi:hypothetical protein
MRSFLRKLGRPAVYGALLVSIGTAAQDRFSGESLVYLLTTVVAAFGPAAASRSK